MLAEGYHLRLQIGGVDYYWRLETPQHLIASDLSAFTPQSSSGGLTLTSLDHQQAFEQRTFSSGMGQVEMIEPTAYRIADGIDTRTAGHVTLWTKTATVEVDPASSLSLASGTLDSGTADTDYLIMGGIGGVWVWDGTSVTDISAGLTNTNVREVYHNGSHLFAGLSGAAIMRFTGDVASPAWTDVSGGDTVGDGAPIDAQAFCVHQGFFWHAQATSRSNLIHYGRLDTLADQEGDIHTDADPDGTHPHLSSTGDLDPVEVGPIGYPVKKLVSYDGTLYAFRVDGIWTVQLEQSPSSPQAGQYVAYKLFDYSQEVRDSNFDAVAVWNGALFFGVANKLFRFAGGTLQDVTPPAFTMDYPPTRHSPCLALLPVGPNLYALFADNLYVTEGAGRTDASSWHLLAADLLGDATEGALAYYPGAPDYARLCAYLTEDGTDTVLVHWRADDEYARSPFDTDAAYSLYTSRFDAGFVAVDKHWDELKVFAHIPAVGGSIRVYAYSFDDASVTKHVLGNVTKADGPATVTVEALETVWNRVLVSMPFPDDATGKALELRFDLSAEGTDGTASPILYGYLLQYVLRPPTIWGYQVRLRLADDLTTMDGRPDPYTAEQKLRLLEEARDSITPLEFEDFIGHSGEVYVTAIREQPTAWRVPEAAEGPEIEVVISLLHLADTCTGLVVESNLVVSTPYIVLCSLEVASGITFEVSA